MVDTSHAYEIRKSGYTAVMSTGKNMYNNIICDQATEKPILYMKFVEFSNTNIFKQMLLRNLMKLTDCV